MSSIISNQSYRYLFYATGISNLCNGLSALVFPWLATLNTRDPMLVAMVVIVNRLPWFLMSIPVGVLNHRRDRKELETDNGQIWSIEQIMSSFICPPLAGFLIAVSVPTPFALDALTFGLAEWLVLKISIPAIVPKPLQSLLTSIGKAWYWMQGNPTVLRLVLVLGLLNLQSTLFITLLVVVAQDILLL